MLTKNGENEAFLSCCRRYHLIVALSSSIGIWRNSLAASEDRTSLDQPKRRVGSLAACEFSMLKGLGMLTFRSDMLLRVDGSVDAFYIGATGKCRRLRSS